MGFPGGPVVKNLPASAGDTRNTGSTPGLGRSPEVGKWQPTPVFLPGKFHGQRSLEGYRPWDHRVGHNWASEHTHSTATYGAVYTNHTVTIKLKPRAETWNTNKRKFRRMSYTTTKLKWQKSKGKETMKKQSNQKTKGRMAILRLRISTITLNVNVLNLPTERQSGWVD